MNIINTNQIVDPNVQQPFTGKSLTFLQNSTKEMLDAIVSGMLGYKPSPTVPVALYGAVETALGGGDFSYSEGYIYFNGEIYKLEYVASIHILTGKEVTITTTADPTADPVVFFDNSTKNVHDVRKLVISDGWGGDFQFSSVIYLQNIAIKSKCLNIGAWNMDTTDNVIVAHGLNYLKIRNISAIIFNDSLSFATELISSDDGGTSGDTMIYFDATYIRLYRRVGGMYDSVGYANTPTIDGVVTRGYIKIDYVI